MHTTANVVALGILEIMVANGAFDVQARDTTSPGGDCSSACQSRTSRVVREFRGCHNKNS